MAGGGRVSVSESALSAARALISAGKVNDAPWSLSAAEEDAILGTSPNWDRYGQWFLGRRTGVDAATKDAYAYPYGKAGQLYRRALVAAKQRASQQGHAAVFKAASELLTACDGDEARGRVVRAREVYARAVDLQAQAPASGEEWPEVQRVQAFPFGEVHDLNGKVRMVTEEGCRAIVAEFNARSTDCPISYDHYGVPNSPMTTTAPVGAAGWLKAIEAVVPESGTPVDPTVHGVWHVIEWTPPARQKLANREYRYYSPEGYVNDDGVMIEANGGGLTNYPAIRGMLPVAARETSQETGGETAEQDSAAKGAERQGVGMDELLKELGVATLEEAKTALADLRAKAAAAGKAAEEATTVASQLEQVTARVKQLEPLAEKVKQLETEKAEAQVAAFLAEAREQLGDLDEKTAVYARKVAARDLTEAREWLAIQPKPAKVEPPAPGRLPIQSRAAQAGSGAMVMTFATGHDEELDVVAKAAVMARERKIPLDRAIALVEGGV